MELIEQLELAQYMLDNGMIDKKTFELVVYGLSLPFDESRSYY